MLISFNFKFEGSMLAQHLKVDPLKFVKYAKEAGCQVIITEKKSDPLNSINSTSH